MLHCPNGATGMYGDTCTFSCNPGYELQGVQFGSCLASQTWSRGLPNCVARNCPARILTSNTSFLSLADSPCTQTYLSRCKVYCRDGFTGEEVIYLCNVTTHPRVLNWIPIGGIHSVCEKSLLIFVK